MSHEFYETKVMYQLLNIASDSREEKEDVQPGQELNLRLIMHER